MVSVRAGCDCVNLGNRLERRAAVARWCVERERSNQIAYFSSVICYVIFIYLFPPQGRKGEERGKDKKKWEKKLNQLVDCEIVWGVEKEEEIWTKVSRSDDVCFFY
jgi:hypothetical protein